SWFEGGAELSGGQWQRIAIARAFMREEADIFILDEPTAALDARAEHALFERFTELVAGRTTLVISHRFATVRMAKRIIVLGHGRIIERGIHTELVVHDSQRRLAARTAWRRCLPVGCEGSRRRISQSP